MHLIFLGAIGSHSLALTSDGILYSWGVPHATGLGRIKPCLSPQIVDTFPIDNIEKEYIKNEKMKKKIRIKNGKEKSNNGTNKSLVVTVTFYYQLFIYLLIYFLPIS